MLVTEGGGDGQLGVRHLENGYIAKENCPFYRKTKDNKIMTIGIHK